MYQQLLRIPQQSLRSPSAIHHLRRTQSFHHYSSTPPNLRAAEPPLPNLPKGEKSLMWMAGAGLVFIASYLYLKENPVSLPYNVSLLLLGVTY